MTSDPSGVESLDIFRTLPEGIRETVIARLETRTVPGGEALIRRGEAADALYVVVNGRLDVSVAGGPPLARLGRGEPVGEVAFFTGGTRTADVIAARDTEVLAIGRAEFEALANENPGLWASVAKALAGRLAGVATAGAETHPEAARPRTVVLVPMGEAPLPEGFAARLADAARALGQRVLLVDADAATRAAGGDGVGGPALDRWLAIGEGTHDLSLYVAEADDDWGRKAVRQADLALLVGAGGPEGRSVLEPLVAERLRPADRRLAVLKGRVSEWLSGREAGGWGRADAPREVARLARFLTGRARGLVLGGGGALGAAHVGIHFAMREAGLGVDAYAGTSAGGALGAALAMDLPRAEIVDRAEDIFLTNKSLRRWTVPRYGLVDPATTDRMLQQHYGEGAVEDLPNPFFAVAADLVGNEAVVMERGPLWEAVRATCSIPALLPPFIDREGRVLVDGGVMDNLPVDAMRARKRGPNAAVILGPSRWQRTDAAYADYPSTRRMLAESVPLRRRGRKGPRLPKIGQVLTRTLLLASDAQAQDALTRTQLVLQPPLPKGMGILSWARFRAFEAEAYDWARVELDRMARETPEVLDAFRD